MNIVQPDINSEVYKTFTEMVRAKVGQAEIWLIEHKIDYIWNYWAGNHLYRIYIPAKDLLLDFEYYPVNNIEYNYIRVNYDTDVCDLLTKVFPKIILDTSELTAWKLNQRSANKFFRENKASPIYDKNVLRIALVQDLTIYQCIVVKDNKVIANVIRQGCSIPYGTYMLFRYLNEMFGMAEIEIRESTENSYTNTMYQLLNLPILSQTTKKKVWWSPKGAKWHIKKEHTKQYVPFYFCEYRIYKYS